MKPALAMLLSGFLSASASAQVVTTIAGIGTGISGGGSGYSGDGGPATSAAINEPIGIALDAQGNIFFADSLNFVVRRLDAVTGVITTVAGNGAQGFSGDGGFATSARLGSPVGMFASEVGHLYIADQSNHRIRFVSSESTVIVTVAGNGIVGFSGDGGLATSARLNNPQGVCVDLLGNIIIADNLNFRIRRVDATTGIITTIAGTGFPSSTGDGGLAQGASFTSPRRVAVDQLNNIYILDSASNARIRRIDFNTGVISTVAGGGTETGMSGPATAMRLYQAQDLAVDDHGVLFVAGTFRVWRVESGTATVVAGTGLQGFGGDGGPPLAATFNNIAGIAIHTAGELIVSDRSNHRIRKITPAPPACPADFNGIDGVSVQDVFDFLNAWFAGCTGQPGTPCNGANADVNGGGLAVSDIFAFLNTWFAGC